MMWKRGGTLQTNRKRRGRNFTAASFIFYCCLFILAQRKLLSRENKGFLCYCFFPAPVSPIIIFQLSFFLRGVGVTLTLPILMPVLPLHSHNPVIRSLFFYLLFSPMVGIDQVTRQQQGNQFHGCVFISLSGVLYITMVPNRSDIS